ncbi:PilT/PilU family type 4a pilus ATPase [Chitinivorax sp. PXF-14]|uniref:PilT/PilU family type 4a pilus ATPase n=1 Tax=Chitinivorax sp. PXF-14 TaxID=3230488 RepID=UPI0034662851
MDLKPLFRLMAEKQASDLFFTAGAPIQIKIQGNIVGVNQQMLSADQVKQCAYSLMDEERIARFEREWEMNFGIPVAEVGSFRVNVFRQRGAVAMVIRYIKANPPMLHELEMPDGLDELCMLKRGLVLVVGATGSGKSSTLAAMLNYRNNAKPGHILTLEDPIEFQHRHKKCIVNQREVGIDTHSYEDALKNAMREAPDVLMIGEIRDKDTLSHALTYAQSGHLCLSTLHANNSYHTMNRIINFFPEDARASLLLDLSTSLRAVISQRLVRGIDGKLIPAVEVLLNTNRIAELIKNGEIDQIKEAMENSLSQGSQTFEQSLYKLYRDGRITLDEAMLNADSPTNLHWLVSHGQSHDETDQARPHSKQEAQQEQPVSFDIDLIDEQH